MQKKGDVSPLFKFLLVLFAGILIILFFIGFGKNIFRTGETLNAIEVRETFNDYFTALSTSSYSLQTPTDLKIDTTLFFHNPSCGQLAIQQGETLSNPAEYSHIIYAPKSLSGRSLEVWKYPWFYPYYIGNFFYLTNKRIKTVVVGEEELIQQLFEEIPPNLDIEQGKSNKINDYNSLTQNYDLIKIVVIGKAEPKKENNILLISVLPEDTSCAAQADGTDRFKCHGMIQFPDGTVPFYGKAMLYASLFVNSAADYQCNFNAAAKQLQAVSEIYAQKQTLLKQKLSSCREYTLDFAWSQDGSGWAQKANNLYEANDQFGAWRSCEYVF